MEILTQWSQKNLEMNCGGQGDNSVDKVLALESYEAYQYKNK